MELTLNGEKKTLEGPVTILALLQTLGLAAERVAVEVNRQVVPRARHGSHTLADGDTVEVVTFVGGG